MGQPGSPKVVDQIVPVDALGNDLDNVVPGSTAQPGLVYQPGAAYPNGSKWSGNKTNDLVALVTKAQAMHGERVIAIDLQFVAGVATWNSGAAIDFGGDVLLVGVRNLTSGQIPSLTFDLNTRIVASGRIETRDLAIAVASSNTGPVITLDATHKVEIVASGNTTIVSKAASREWVRASVNSQTVTLQDLAAFPAGQGGGGSTFAAASTTSGSLTVQCFGASAVGQGAVDAASCFISVRAPGVVVDPAFGARVNLFPGVLYVASGTPGSVGVTATAPGCVYLDDGSGTGYYWNGSAWVAQSGGGGSVPTGTGFTHVTGGAQDGAARAVNLATADVTGTLPTGNQAAQAMGGQASGTTAASTNTNATMPAGNVPQLGSGNTTLSPDGTSGTINERQGNWTALSTDAATVVPVSPAMSAVPASNVCTVTVEIHLTKDGDTTAAGFGVWRRTILVRNVAGSLLNPAGLTTDVDLSPASNLGANVAAATSVIDVSGTTPQIKVTRPAGVACHARVVVVDQAYGWSGV